MRGEVHEGQEGMQDERRCAEHEKHALVGVFCMFSE